MGYCNCLKTTCSIIKNVIYYVDGKYLVQRLIVINFPNGKRKLKITCFIRWQKTGNEQRLYVTQSTVAILR